MLIKKSSVNKHKIISNNNIRNIHHNKQQPPSTSPSVASAFAFSFLTSATSHNAQQHRHQHRGFFKRVLMRQNHHQRRTCERWCSLWWCLSSVITVLGVIMLPLPPQCEAVGYSYTRFRGPVSGPEHLIYHNDHGQYQRGAGAGAGVDAADENQAAHLDYVAKPEYEFAYGVEDAQAHILHNRNEMRDGDSVKGVYSVVDPDGTLRVVKYTADDINGFQAEVIKNGISSIHGQLQPDTPTTISNYNNNQNNNYNNDPYGNQYPSNNNNNNYHPSYRYPTPVPHGGNPPTTTNDYNNINNNNNDYDDRPDINNGNNNNNNGGDYLPQYEVHEKPSHEDEGDDTEDEEDQYDAKKDQGGRDGAGSKNKDYDDGEGEGEGEEEEDDVDDYDDSDELEDYDEAVKNQQAASDESDEYY